MCRLAWLCSNTEPMHSSESRQPFQFTRITATVAGRAKRGSAFIGTTLPEVGWEDHYFAPGRRCPCSVGCHVGAITTRYATLSGSTHEKVNSTDSVAGREPLFPDFHGG